MYSAQGALDRDQLVVQYAPLVKRIAFHLLAKLPPSVQADDLIQNGMLGLIDAIGRFEDGLGAQFETYAVQRIRGAMLDGLRENDWAPRGVRREMRRVEQAIQMLEHQHGRVPSESELADALGMALHDYQRLLQDARGHQILYFEDLADGEEEDYLERNYAGPDLDPLEFLAGKDLREGLVKAIGELPDREKMVMALYYDEELNLREIGEVMGVTESRVCQLHSQAVARLRAAVVGEDRPLPRSRRGRRPKQSEGA